MNAAMVSRILSLIPDRMARTQTGCTFMNVDATGCRYPERLAHISQFLHWTGPLTALTKDDQRILGLLNAQGRPVHAADAEEGEIEGVLDDGIVDHEAADHEEEEFDLEPVVAVEAPEPVASQHAAL